MRRALCLALGLVLLAGMSIDAVAARQKPVKRAKVSRSKPRPPVERLVDRGGVPNSAPGPDLPQSPPPGQPALPRFVSVAAREFSLTLSRPAVATGAVRIELRNNGEDPHNLVVSPEGTHTVLAAFTELGPGAYERRSVTLPPGRHRLWCSLEFHEELGMSVTLRAE